MSDKFLHVHTKELKTNGNLMGKITGTLTDCITGKKRQVQLDWIIHKIEPLQIRIYDKKQGLFVLVKRKDPSCEIALQLIGGPTGFESIIIDGKHAEDTKLLKKDGWVANVMSYRRYDELFILGAEMAKVFDIIKGEQSEC